jgi:glycosyltransferase involved in cell wall biosynthesis
VSGGARVALIGAARYPIAEPFAGGLEAHVWALARGLRRRGHEVTLFAGPGSDPALGVEVLDVRLPRISDAARADVSMPPAHWLDEHHAYLNLMLRLAGELRGAFDIVHNHSLHHLPIAMAGTLDVPMLSTLHTPPTPWLESAVQAREHCPVTFAAVSDHTAAAWSDLLPRVRVVPNGVDVERWPVGPGGGPVVWFGRLVPEKGAHLAIDAAVRAGAAIDVAGPVFDRAYFQREVQPRLALPGVRYLGHLTHDRLHTVLGGATAVVVTPCWDEPYGLVVAEALACGTPVCGFARGALPELLDDDCGRLVAGGDVEGLAAAIATAPTLSRHAARRRAETTCSIAVMIDRYEQLYAELAGRVAA